MIVRQGRQHSIIQKLLGQQSFFEIETKLPKLQGLR